MSLQRGLEVVVPKRYDLRRVPQLIESKRHWILSTKKHFDQLPKPEPVNPRPAEINLIALSEKWTVEYVLINERRVTLQEIAPGQLRVSGKIDHDPSCRRVLQAWLLGRATKTLIPWLERTSEETALPFAGASVRMQRSRWGSCSRRKTISLNAGLLFLAPELVRYLFIHELCHTVHLNHSDRYWKLVELKEPAFKILDKQMTHAMRFVPGWAANS